MSTFVLTILYELASASYESLFVSVVHASVNFFGSLTAVVVVWSLSHVPPFCSPMDCNLPGSSVHGISQAGTGVGRHFLFQGIFPTQGSNLHRQAGSFPLSHQGSPVSLYTLH